MDDVIHISISYSEGAIRLFKETVRSLQTPPYVKFYINRDKLLLAIAADNQKTLKTHRIPKNIYNDEGKMRIYSKSFCDILYREMHWDKNLIYRLPGRMMKENNAACFDLKKAEILK